MIENPVPWPNGCRVACAITFDIDTDSILHLEHRENAIGLTATMSWLKYDEIAVPRLVKMYAEYGIKQTFFYPAWCMEQYPHLVDVILEGGHEIAAHGYIHENANQIHPDDEIYWFEKQIEVIERMTGQRPRGWRAPLYNFSENSLDYLIENGIQYDASLMGDDVPYLLKSEKGQVIELPSHWGMDDWPPYVHEPNFHYKMPIKSPDEAMRVFMAEFEAMYEYGGLWIAVWHPFVSARLARCHRIGKMIEEMQNRGGVWFAKMEEIASHVQSCIDNGSWTPRVHNLPYYDSPVIRKENHKIA